MRSALNATLALILTVSAFIPLGPHVLTHALDVEHHHDHDGVAHDHDGDHHRHEFQPSPDGVGIATSGVRMPAPVFSVVVLAVEEPAGSSAAAPSLAARSLDPPGGAPSSQFAALCSGTRAPPAA